MADGAVHADRTARARDDTPTGGEDVSALTAHAAELGTEIVRFTRLIAAWKQRAKYDSGAADRVLLARLVSGGDRRATDLAADVFLDLSTVSRQVRSLVERGLVGRYPDPEDRRGTLLTATAAGRSAYQEYSRQRDAQLAGLLQSWPSEDCAELVRLMGRLNDQIADAQHAPLSPGGDKDVAVDRET